ncbi:aspartate carbamoyltransferase regulatory subunit [Clostridium sp. 19966]|uniref:aspartate carbamoyltransferase regulatory subunit n=1 Tax=Clostridium sp. 19966 TaxID=2768166 RepID=UPI0028DD9E0F|nr:aspartate carbamoyltransferase regulatory subunit [Clostridium sp. 19966]MDT8719386.1 aspartate carbamoyltransferase regulatory subunit [Clostridium sp. 19966]
MVTINSIKRGIVIDHITAGLGVKIFNYLKLEKADFSVALIMNAPSSKLGRKDIIKIDNELFIDLNVLGLIDPNITINIIEQERIIDKIKLELPEQVENVITCKNPRCVTSVEKGIPHVFHLVNRENREYRCEYCDDIRKFEDL